MQNRVHEPFDCDFWAELAPSEPPVQVYLDHTTLVETLYAFTASALRAGEGVILIATPGHRGAVERRLFADGCDLEKVRADGRYTDVDALTLLRSFITDDGMPVRERFLRSVTPLLERAREGGRGVRAFGEMVALLWEMGHCEGVFELERCWQEVCMRERVRVFCAYPRGCSGSHDMAESAASQLPSRVVRS